MGEMLMTLMGDGPILKLTLMGDGPILKRVPESFGRV